MLLTELLADLPGVAASAPAGSEAIRITGVTSDSRAVESGFVFVAVPGVKADGGSYVADAVRRGAVAVVVEASSAVEVSAPVAVVRVGNTRRTLAALAAAFYRGQPETVVAVTGTSGKTSVAEFTRQIFAALGKKSASLGTLGVMTDAGLSEGALTTPGPVELHKMLAGLARDGVTHLAMEASSHGLDQYRLDGVRLAAGAFTNLGRDHMDYHPTVEAYFEAKMRLFDELLPKDAPVIVNADGAWADEVISVAKKSGHPVFASGRRAPDGLYLEDVARDGFTQVLKLKFPFGRMSVRLPLVGAYQVENALVAANIAIALDAGGGIPILEALETLRGVPGRLEIIGESKGGLAIVDYAHKPEALAAALDACRPFATSRLICVFGCGGDRDRGKRPIMGRIAVEKADVVIVTDDNPRSENPATIRAEVLAGTAGAREIGDRGEAIAVAVAMMGKGDVVVVAGKGHETGQKIGDTVIPFSDHDEIRKALGTA